VTRPRYMMRAIAFAVVFLWAPTVARAGEALDRAEIADLFSQAKQFFHDANDLSATDRTAAVDLYRKAVMRFERIVRDGRINNGRLYYNIGNTYFRMGDIGRAILNYRRAEPLLPNDNNLRQNLDYARRQRVDRIDEKERVRLLKTLFFWHYDLTSRVRLTAFAACFAVFWLCAAARIFVRKGLLNWILVLSGVIWVLFLASLGAEEINAARSSSGVVLADDVIGRKGDAETYQPSFEEPLHAGTEFRLVESRQDWYHIELADGRSSWIPRKAAELVR